MLSDRDRRVLARIEAQLMESDPDLARLFHDGPRRSPAGSVPRTLLVVGLGMIVLGAVVTAVPVALFGVLLTFVAIWAACVRPERFGRTQLA